MQISLDGPWLTADLATPHRVLSWAPHRGGLVTARQVVWRQVRDADLPEGHDATLWLAEELAVRGAAEAVTMMTARNVSAWHHARAEVEGVAAECLATAGLSNAERVGHRQAPGYRFWGTINLAVQVSAGLTFPAMLEALSIAAEARTAAVIEAGIALPQGPATGTGTDCIAIAAPEHAAQGAYAGKHTPLGEAIGRAVHQAAGDAVAEWLRWLAEQTGR